MYSPTETLLMLLLLWDWIRTHDHVLAVKLVDTAGLRTRQCMKACHAEAHRYMSKTLNEYVRLLGANSTEQLNLDNMA